MPFQAGVSGNKNGRPKNTGCRQKLFNDLVLPHRDKLINQAIDMALNGNETMLKLFLERMLPNKPIDDHTDIDLPSRDFTQASMLLSIGAAIINAIANNEITPAEGQSLLDVLSTQRKNIEASSLEERINEIEFLLYLRKPEKKYA